MTSDHSHHRAKTDLLRELENLREQLDNPDNADLNEDDIPILLDKVEKAVADAPDTEELAEEGLDPEEIEALRQAYQQATDDLQESEARLLQQAVQNLKEDRDSIESVSGDAWQSSAPDVLPGQQSLFDAEAEQDKQEPAARPPAAKPPPRPKALGDNPFLPKHIRDRLQERRQALENDIAQASAFFPKSGAESRVPARPVGGMQTHQDLVDQLVAEYLPRIEADLRSRLMRKLSEAEPKPEDRS